MAGRGQLTIEYLIVLVIALILFSGVSLDLINTSMADASVLQSAEMVKSAKLTLGSIVDGFTTQGVGARKTVSLRAPPDCDYIVSSTQIIVACRGGTPSYNASFNNQPITKTTSQVIAYTCTTCADPTMIESGNLELVQVQKQ